MLGYLRPVSWADALRNHKDCTNKERIYELMREQEAEFSFELIPDVEWLAGDAKAFKEALKEKR